MKLQSILIIALFPIMALAQEPVIPKNKFRLWGAGVQTCIRQDYSQGGFHTASYFQTAANVYFSHGKYCFQTISFSPGRAGSVLSKGDSGSFRYSKIIYMNLSWQFRNYYRVFGSDSWKLFWGVGLELEFYSQKADYPGYFAKTSRLSISPQISTGMRKVFKPGFFIEQGFIWNFLPNLGMIPQQGSSHYGNSFIGINLSFGWTKKIKGI